MNTSKTRLTRLKLELGWPILPTLLMISSLSVKSQQPYEVFVGPGKSAERVFIYKDKYRFSQFQDGYFTSKEGAKSRPSKLNFNLVSKTPVFIGAKGDTLRLNPELAHVVLMGGTKYVKSSGSYYEVIQDSLPVRLGIERGWRLVRKENFYSDPNRGGTAATISRDGGSMVYSPELGKMVRNETSVFRKDSSYVFIDSDGSARPASKGNLTRSFKAHKKTIEDYINQENIRFRREEDLIKLIQFCSNLPK